jgi:uncharacterized protein (TIRG00374 family)
VNDQPESAFTKPGQTRWRRYTPIIGLLLLAWVLSRVDLTSMREATRALLPRTLALAAAYFCANILLKSIRWHRMLRAQRIELPWRISLAAYLNGQFYGQVTLGHVGEFYRAEALLERKLPLGLAMSSCLFDRFLDVLIVLGLAMVLGALVVGDLQAALVAAALLGGSLALVVFLWAAATYRILPDRLTDLGTRLVDRMRENRILARLIHGVTGLLQGSRALIRPRPLLEALTWSALAWLFYFGTLWQLSAGMGLALDFVILTAAASLAALSSLVPITVAGLGVREVVFAEVLALRGTTMASAVVLSLTNFAVIVTSTLALGIVGLIWRQKQLSAGSSLP